MAWKFSNAIRVDSVSNFQHSWADGDDLTVEDLIRDGAAMDHATLAEKNRLAMAEPLLHGNLVSPDSGTTGVNVTLQYPERQPLAHVNQGAGQITGAELPGDLIGLLGPLQRLVESILQSAEVPGQTLAHPRIVVGPILQQLRAPGSPIENIRGVFKMWEKMAGEGVYYGCLVGNSSASYNDPGMCQRLARYFGTLEDAFYETLKRAQEADEISRKLSPRDLARTLVHVGQGLALLSRVLQDPKMVKSVVKTSMAMLKAS